MNVKTHFMNVAEVAKGFMLAITLGVGSLSAAQFDVDVSHSSVGFKVKHMMVSSVKGHFDDFSGSFSYDAASRQFTALDGTVRVTSITTKESKRDNHLRDKDFFDVKQFPTMRLKLLNSNGPTGTFELTIKDVSKKVTLDIEEVSGIVRDPWGNQRMGFELHGKINRKAFNISFNQLMETGGLMVGDEVTLEITIEGIMKK